VINLTENIVIDDFNDIRANTIPVAKQQAKTALRNQNKSEWQCDITIIGNTRMMSGVTFIIEGFGIYDGKYIANSVTHSLSGRYTTRVQGHRVLQGY
jgi:hypothetical protein